MFDFFENDMKELGYELEYNKNGYVSRSACMGEAKNVSVVLFMRLFALVEELR